jgi:hypothetical protein
MKQPDGKIIDADGANGQHVNPVAHKEDDTGIEALEN